MSEILNKAISTYGENAQKDMVIEEMAGLTKAICKNKRGEDNRNNIIEEIADVEIMLSQLKIIFDIDDSEIIAVKNQKLARLVERLGKCQ